MEVHAAPGLGGAQPADGKQIDLCAVAVVRRPDDVLGRSTHLEVEQRGMARSHASARRDGEHGQFLKVLNLPALRRIWERGRSQRPERWRSVKGPVGATFLSLDRIKWTWPSPFQFFDDNNTEILLTTTSPALLESMLNAAVCRTNQREAAAKLADSSHFTGTTVSLEIARRVADSKGGRLSRKESSSLRNAAVNAIWTKCEGSGL